MLFRSLKLLDALFDPDLFKPVPCNYAFTSVISSPECCAWYNYSYTIIEQGDKNIIACFDKNAGTGIQAIEDDIEVVKKELAEKQEEKKALEQAIRLSGRNYDTKKYIEKA